MGEVVARNVWGGIKKINKGKIYFIFIFILYYFNRKEKFVASCWLLTSLC